MSAIDESPVPNPISRIIFDLFSINSFNDLFVGFVSFDFLDLNDFNIREIVKNANVPIIVDAGVGTASDACIAMELGCDGVLMNTAIACSKEPILMASAMKNAVKAGYDAYNAGRIPKKELDLS